MEFAWNTQKNKMTDIKGLEMEQERKGKITNEDIDLLKTDLNYDLVKSELNLYNRVKNRIEAVRSVSRIQKNSVVDYSNIITVPKEQADKWGIDKTKDYFKGVYSYFCDEFGKENVVSAKVHLDETSPHMHLHFVPVSHEGKLQARNVMTPVRINKVHTEAPKYLQGKGFDVERGQGKTEKSLEIKKYKEKMLEEKIKELESELKIKNEKIKLFSDIEFKIKSVDEIKINKKLMSSKIYIELADFEELKNSFKKLKIIQLENKKLESEIEITINKNIEFQKEIKKLNLEIDDKEKIKKQLNEKENDFKILNRVLNNNLDLKKIFDLKLNFEKEKIKYEKNFEKLFGDVDVKILKSNLEKLKENNILKLKNINDFIQNNFEENKKIRIGFISEKKKEILFFDWNLKDKNFYNVISENKKIANVLKNEIIINENNLSILNSLGGFFKLTIEEQEGQNKNRISPVENKLKKKNNIGMEF